MDLELSAKVAVVTGASKGIGLAVTGAIAAAFVAPWVEQPRPTAENARAARRAAVNRA
jgi:NAD(P)-dependent dehydrogenase (short-subunit alcohol dehydrogenase family)